MSSGGELIVHFDDAIEYCRSHLTTMKAMKFQKDMNFQFGLIYPKQLSTGV